MLESVDHDLGKKFWSFLLTSLWIVQTFDNCQETVVFSDTEVFLCLLHVVFTQAISTFIWAWCYKKVINRPTRVEHANHFFLSELTFSRLLIQTDSSCSLKNESTPSTTSLQVTPTRAEQTRSTKPLTTGRHWKKNFLNHKSPIKLDPQFAVVKIKSEARGQLSSP